MNVPAVPSSLAASVAQSQQANTPRAKTSAQANATARPRDEFIAGVSQADATDPDSQKDRHEDRHNRYRDPPEHDLKKKTQKKKTSLSKPNATLDVKPNDPPRIDVTG